MPFDRSRIYETAEDFFRDGNSAMVLTPNAAVEVSNQAAQRGMVVARVEGGIWHNPGFELRGNCMWDGEVPPIEEDRATLNNAQAARFIQSESTQHSAFVLTAAPITGWRHRECDMSPEAGALREFFAAINRNDMQAMTKDFDPEIVRIEPPGFPTAGAYRGVAQVQEHVTKGRGTWAEGSCDPEKFLVNGDKVVVYLHARVRLKDKVDWIDGRFADGFVFRNGKITEYLTFWEREDALKWAGIEDR